MFGERQGRASRGGAARTAGCWTSPCARPTTRPRRRCSTAGSTGPTPRKSGSISMAATTSCRSAAPAAARRCSGSSAAAATTGSSIRRPPAARGSTTRGGTNAVEGTRRVPLDDRPYDEWRLSDSTPYPPRDWGGFWRFQPWVSSGPEVGFFFGGGLVRYNFGFRKQPYRSRLGAPGRLRDRRRDLPGRVHGGLPPGQLARADQPAAPRLGHRGGPVLRFRQRDAADRLGLLLPRPAGAVSHPAERGVSGGDAGAASRSARRSSTPIPTSSRAGSSPSSRRSASGASAWSGRARASELGRAGRAGGPPRACT